MKLLLSLLSFLSPLLILAQSSIYHPFPDSNAVWNEEYDFFDHYPSPISIDNYSIAISGDTMINGLQYHKLITPYVQHQYIPPHFIGPLVPTGYRGAFRQDTVARMVYFVASGDSSETVLYDFNMGIGDTILDQTNCAVTVYSMDSILIGSDYRKRWNIAGSIQGPFEIIEGMGSSIGLLKTWLCDGDGFKNYLICFQQNGVTRWPSPSSTPCHLINTTEEPISQNRLYTLSPNPFHEYSMIVTYAAFDQLEIFNSLGVRVRCQKVDSGELIIERTSLPAGMYYFHLSSHKRLNISGKFIIN